MCKSSHVYRMYETTPETMFLKKKKLKIFRLKKHEKSFIEKKHEKTFQSL